MGWAHVAGLVQVVPWGRWQGSVAKRRAHLSP